MKKVRCKFVVSSVQESTDETKTIALHAVYQGSEENKEFFKYTPNGRVEFATVNTEAAAQFTPGKEFYVDFTPVELAEEAIVGAAGVAETSEGETAAE